MNYYMCLSILKLIIEGFPIYSFCNAHKKVCVFILKPNSLYEKINIVSEIQCNDSNFTRNVIKIKFYENIFFYYFLKK